MTRAAALLGLDAGQDEGGVSAAFHLAVSGGSLLRLDRRKQKRQIFPRESTRLPLFSEHVTNESRFLLLQLEDLLFDRAAGDQAVGDDGAILADAV